MLSQRTLNQELARTQARLTSQKLELEHMEQMRLKVLGKRRSKLQILKDALARLAKLRGVSNVPEPRNEILPHGWGHLPQQIADKRKSIYKLEKRVNFLIREGADY